MEKRTLPTGSGPKNPVQSVCVCVCIVPSHLVRPAVFSDPSGHRSENETHADHSMEQNASAIGRVYGLGHSEALVIQSDHGLCSNFRMISCCLVHPLRQVKPMNGDKTDVKVTVDLECIWACSLASCWGSLPVDLVHSCSGFDSPNPRFA